MGKVVSAADANRQFSRLLREVGEGQSYVVTSHGKPVAQITPIAKHGKLAAKARSALFSRLQTQRVVDAGRWSRDELYEDLG
jgi:prevent-host-death family protein